MSLGESGGEAARRNARSSSDAQAKSGQEACRKRLNSSAGDSIANTECRLGVVEPDRVALCCDDADDVERDTDDSC